VTSLYNRATPRQALVLRMIEGACMNAAHAHPGKPLNQIMARSIAKRAAGTLTSQWRRVLAEPLARSEGGGGELDNRSTARDGDGLTRSGKRGMIGVRRSPGRASDVSWRASLDSLHRAIGNAVGNARRDGSLERAAALIEVLRLIDRMKAGGPRSRRMKL